MIAEFRSRVWWWRGALAGVVLAVAAGVLGMHVLTAGHSAHAVDAGGHQTQPGASDPGVDAAQGTDLGGERGLPDHATHSHVHPGSEPASTEMSSSVGSLSLGVSARGDVGRAGASHPGSMVPACDTDCTSDIGSVCLAVILLVLLLLGHAWIRGHVEAARSSSARLVPALGVGPPRPLLVQLCVSRT